MITKKTLAQVTLISVIIYISIIYSYQSLILKDYAYMGFSGEINLFALFLSIIVLALISVSIFLVKREDKRFVLSLFLIFFITPNFVYTVFNLSHLFIAAYLLFGYLITLSTMLLMRDIRVPSLKSEQKSTLIWGLFTVSFLIVFLEYRGNIKLSFQYFLLDSELIYDTRLRAREMSSTLTNYAYFTLSRVVAPIMILYGLKNRNLLMVILGLISLLYMFLATGHRSVLLSSIFIIGFYILSVKYELISKALLIGVLIVVATSLFIRIALGVDDLESLFVRRLLMLPAMLNSHYFEYFRDAPLYYSSSFLSSFIDYEGELPPAFLIGEYYFGNVYTRANNGYISDGYMNLGLLGVVIHVIVVAVLLRILCSGRISNRYYGILFMFFYSIHGSALSISLITHGGLLLIILSLTVLSESGEKSYKQKLDN